MWHPGCNSRLSRDKRFDKGGGGNSRLSLDERFDRGEVIVGYHVTKVLIGGGNSRLSRDKRFDKGGGGGGNSRLLRD